MLNHYSHIFINYFTFLLITTTYSKINLPSFLPFFRLLALCYILLYQNLKNKIAGKNCEAAMIFPDKNFKLDRTYNYIYVLPEGAYLPFGNKIGCTNYTKSKVFFILNTENK